MHDNKYSILTPCLVYEILGNAWSESGFYFRSYVLYFVSVICIARDAIFAHALAAVNTESDCPPKKYKKIISRHISEECEKKIAGNFSF